MRDSFGRLLPRDKDEENGGYGDSGCIEYEVMQHCQHQKIDDESTVRVWLVDG